MYVMPESYKGSMISVIQKTWIEKWYLLYNAHCLWNKPNLDE